MLYEGVNLNNCDNSKLINCMLKNIKMCKSSERVRKFKRKIIKSIHQNLKNIKDSKERLYFQRFFLNQQKHLKFRSKFYPLHLSNDDTIISKESGTVENIDWEHLISLQKDFTHIYRYLSLNRHYVNSFIYPTFVYDISWKV